MTKIKVTLPNGLSFEGEKALVRDVLEATGYMQKDVKYYYSKSRGLLPISDMHTSHIMNAVRKMYREWVEDLSNETDPKVLSRKIVKGPSDPAFVNLVVEMAKRDEPK